MHRVVHAMNPVQEGQGERQRHFRDGGCHGLACLRDADAAGKHLIGDERPDAGPGVGHECERWHPVQQLSPQLRQSPARDEHLHLIEVGLCGEGIDPEHGGATQGDGGVLEQAAGGLVEELPGQCLRHDREQDGVVPHLRTSRPAPPISWASRSSEARRASTGPATESTGQRSRRGDRTSLCSAWNRSTVPSVPGNR